MKSKHYTILVVPERTKNVRQLKIPKLLIKLSIASLVVLIVFSVLITMSYMSIRDRMANYQELERENNIKGEQIKMISAKVDKIKSQMENIEKLNGQLRIIANLELPETSNKSLGVGGPSPEMFEDISFLSESEERVIRQLHDSIDKFQAKTIVEEESLLELINFLENQKSFLASSPSVWPTRGVKTSNFGYRVSPFTGKKGFHNGVDIAAREGTPIIAAADGIVEVAKNDLYYGNLVIIDHGYGLKTKYGHMVAFLVEPGQKIRRGDKVGYVGNTGRSTGSHLHYEVRVDKVAVNPLKYILN